jgi:hypothetical protein
MVLNLLNLFSGSPVMQRSAPWLVTGATQLQKKQEASNTRCPMTGECWPPSGKFHKGKETASRIIRDGLPLQPSHRQAHDYIFEFYIKNTTIF